MDIEKLKAILGIEDIDDAKLQAVLDTMQEENRGLLATVEATRRDKKTVKEQLKKLKDEHAAEIAELKEQMEELRDSGETGKDDGDDGNGKAELSRLTRELREKEREMKKLVEQLGAANDRIGSLVSERDGALIDREINAAVKELDRALDKDGKKLSPAGRRYLSEVLRHRARVVEDDDVASVMLPNKDDLDLPPSDYLLDWSRSDEAKDFIVAPNNSGGGSGGGGPVGGDKKPEDYTEQERTQLYRENPVRFRELFGRK